MSLVVLCLRLHSWGPRFSPGSGNYIPHTVNKSLHAVTKDPVCMCMHAQPCLTLYDPMGCNPPGNSVHGILQAGILERVAISNSRGSSQPKDQTHISCIGRQILCHRPPQKPIQRALLPLYLLPCLQGLVDALSFSLSWDWSRNFL